MQIIIREEMKKARASKKVGTREKSHNEEVGERQESDLESEK